MAAKKETKTAAAAAVAAHYAQLLGIEEPWRVRRAQLDLLSGQVEIEVEYATERAVPCPECGHSCARHDHAPEREWRHLNVMQFLTVIRAALPRCECPEHGVKTVTPPWAEPGSRFTLHFEHFAVQVIQASRSLTQTAELLELDWDAVQRIVDRAVARGLLRRSTEGVRAVGLDEKSFGRGQSYVSVLTDLHGARVLDVVPDRDQAAGEKLWDALPAAQREKVEAAAMDMSAAYVAATQAKAPRCQIVHDRFHASKMLNEAVDKTRREEARRLEEKGDATLKHTRFLWLHGTVPEKQQASFAELLEMNLKTAKAWCFQEMFTEFWAQSGAAQGAEFFRQWSRSVNRSRLEKVKAVARTLKEHLLHLLTYFAHPITNALTEGFNSKIQAIRADARGFRRFANYRARILFFCGKLELLPALAIQKTSH